MAYGISSIGTTPLGTMSDPTMMSMMGGMGMMNGMGTMSPYGTMGMMGMMGMNPQYLEQMAQVQQKMAEIQHQTEQNQINHAIDNHALLQNAEVMNMEAHERAFFQKALSDGDIRVGIRNLSDCIRKGDQDGICQLYDELKQTIYSKYGEFFIQKGDKSDPKKSADYYIYLMYNQILSAQNGGNPVDFKQDVKDYGESAFMNGFRRTFLGNSSHSKRYTEETLNYTTGDPLTDGKSKEKARTAGSLAARGIEAVGAYGAGAVGGLCAWGGLKGISAALPFGSSKALELSKKLGGAGKWAKIVAGLALIGDIGWQMTRS